SGRGGEAHGEREVVNKSPPVATGGLSRGVRCVDSTSGKQLQCVVVTPERAVLDAAAEFVALPMYDGELGVLPGRAPLIGRLGSGELWLRRGEHVVRYFIDGGFV